MIKVQIKGQLIPYSDTPPSYENFRIGTILKFNKNVTSVREKKKNPYMTLPKHRRNFQVQLSIKWQKRATVECIIQFKLSE